MSISECTNSGKPHLPDNTSHHELIKTKSDDMTDGDTQSPARPEGSQKIIIEFNQVCIPSILLLGRLIFLVLVLLNWQSQGLHCIQVEYSLHEKELNISRIDIP